MTITSSKLRIIGGKWRSRQINFKIQPGLRPTTDATRETLFNWITNDLPGSHCLDLFAGSGALSFEALSRGARSVTLVDASLPVIRQLRSTAKQLATENCEFYLARIPERLSKIPPYPFDIIFIDPPFGYGLIKLTLDKLIKSPYLHNNSLIYVECERKLDFVSLIPKHLELTKSKLCHQTQIFLLKVML